MERQGRGVTVGQTRNRESASPGGPPEETRRDEAVEDLFALYDLPGHLVRRCNQIAISIFFAECGPFDVTPVQYSLMSVLSIRPGIEQVVLARLAAHDASTTGNVVARLVRRGLVERGKGAARRSHALFLTAEGRLLLERIGPAMRRVQERILAPLGAAEQQEFLRLLSRLVNVNNDFSRVPVRPQAPTNGG